MNLIQLSKIKVKIKNSIQDNLGQEDDLLLDKNYYKN
jgi:hypothetical protein